MEDDFNSIEVRIIGSLIEKKLSTPDYYPLTLNSLTAACNQKTCRSPVTSYTEEEIQSALKVLVNKRIVWESLCGRSPKYEENFTKPRNLEAPEASILSVLMLRGPQTIGELKTSSVKMHSFKNYEELGAAIGVLADQELIARINKQPGQKEARYAHLLCTEVEYTTDSSFQTEKGPGNKGIEDLISEMADLKKEIEGIKKAFSEFKRQFE